MRLPKKDELDIAQLLVCVCAGYEDVIDKSDFKKLEEVAEGSKPIEALKALDKEILELSTSVAQK
eukprot:6252407-Prorocentrum_lima.AAC.1